MTSRIWVGLVLFCVKTPATLCTYAGLGSDVTSCCIRSLLTNGAVFG